MRKLLVSIAATVLVAVVTLVVIKSFASATSATSARHSAVAPAALATQISMRPIVPAPVIDPNAGVFVGTGDGAGGAWIKP